MFREGLNVPPGASRRKRREMERRYQKRIEKEMLEPYNMEVVAAKAQASIIHHMNNRAGVLSLTGKPMNLLMWAHYAASHSGMMLEFDADAPSFKALGKVWKMCYAKDRITCDCTQPPADLAWFLGKSEEWIYEDEYRIIRDFRFCEPIQKGDSIINLAPLGREAIKSIYMGVNMTENYRKRVLQAINGRSEERRVGKGG